MTKCRHCNGPIVKTSTKGRPRIYCSAECKEAFFVAKDKADRAAKRQGRRCPVCGSPVTVPTLKARCCSKACSVTYGNQQRQAERRGAWEASDPKCARCGVSIAHRRRGSVFCSAECKIATHANTWMKNSPHYMRQYLYGITKDEYEAMLASQDGRCAICRADEPGGKGGWHVDHCHNTKVIRGLLCHHCNIGVGQFKDDPARLRAAADYLERTPP